MSEINLDRARELGADAGRNAASWVFDGNTSRETYARFLKLSDDGDPALHDEFGPTSGWLSGEWADTPTPNSLYAELGLEPDDDEDGEIMAEIADAYEEAADQAYSDELERVARLHTEEESVRGCSCGMADYGAPGHDGHGEA